LNLRDAKYQRHALPREMLEAVDVVVRFKPDVAAAWAEQLSGVSALFVTGEGSSRIFPAKRSVHEALRRGFRLPLATQGAAQALEYDLSAHAVIAVSNSGRTRETLRLLRQLGAQRHPRLFGVTAHAGAPLTTLASPCHVLDCGPEQAVAATKSVIAQALFLQALVTHLAGASMPPLDELSRALREVLEQAIPADCVRTLAQAPAIYFCGRNDGVAEELALKANEIARRKAVYLEGTFAMHGFEEVMVQAEAMVLLEPYVEEEQRFAERFRSGIGMSVIAISARDTLFPTIRIPSLPGYDEYLQLAAGWNLLLELGLHLGLDVDRPLRARKVGNE
jgi:glucosamine--fructose-6-phosphate aminotransferase (isomerizing)